MQLSDPTLLRSQAYINGQWCDAVDQQTTSIYNPADHQLIGLVPNMGAGETQEAINAAQTAQIGWNTVTAKERGVVLMRWHALILQHQDDLAMLITCEQGKPLAEAKAEVAYAASFVQWFAEEAKRMYGDIIPAPQPNMRITVLKQAIGVTAAITPWNFPAAMVTRKIAPALAAGCAMILKPAPQTPFTALALAELAARAGLPKGLLSVVTGDAEAIGQVLCGSPIVRKLSFTGSTAVGIKLMKQCASTLKKLSLELGGNAPFIVFNDADVEAAVAGLMQAKFRNAGQTCVCANRIYVQSRVHDQFVEKLTRAMSSIVVGDGRHQGSQIGPLINTQALAKVQQHVQDALSKGAEVKLGGSAHALGGYYFQPTLLVGATVEMKLAAEETFAPLAPVFKFEDINEVIAKANATEFGLAAYFYSNNFSLIWRVAEALEYGMVGVNTGMISNEVAPFGGIKSSGFGREGSKYGLDEYLTLKYLAMQI